MFKMADTKSNSGKKVFQDKQKPAEIRKLLSNSISSYVNNIEMLITQVVPGTNITVGHRNKTKCV